MHPMIAAGRAQLARHDVRTPAFNGMISASLTGMFAILPPQVIFQALHGNFQSAVCSQSQEARPIS